MENEMRSIGEMARDCGLSVSALRFYDRAGVLVPARVDPVSAYRWYGPEQVAEARLPACLRRAGLPLADIRLVLAGWSGADTDLVRGLLQAHLRRLERELAGARSEFSALRALLDDRENPLTSLSTAVVRLSVPAPEFAAALDAVRFAAATDPDLPVLGGILFDVEGDSLNLVATDRHRMAVARAAAHGYDGPPVRAVVPLPVADAMRALSGGAEPVRLTLDGDRVSLDCADRQAAGHCLEHGFPDYRRLVRPPAGRRITVDVAAFREVLRTGPVREVRGRDGESSGVSVLRVGGDGTLTLCEDGAEQPDDIGVNRDFLLDALAAGARERLILELGASVAPLAVRRPDDDGAFSLLMPVRLEG
ncbi:DNA polymerase III subunit beta family protein [Streptomyces sp. NPDC004457]